MYWRRQPMPAGVWVCAICFLATLVCPVAAVPLEERANEKEDIGTIDVEGARVVYRDIRPSYAKALITVAAEAWLITRVQWWWTRFTRNTETSSIPCPTTTRRWRGRPG